MSIQSASSPSLASPSLASPSLASTPLAPSPTVSSFRFSGPRFWGELCLGPRFLGPYFLGPRWWLLGTITTAAIIAANVAPKVNAQAQTCIPLGVIGGQSTEVTKTVSMPGIFVFQSNWNTDFSVPNHPQFTSFIATVTSSRGTTYDIDVSLKYRDHTADTPYSHHALTLVEHQPLSIAVPARTEANPYQVNLRVGGTVAEGNIYTASVLGCYPALAEGNR